MYRIVQIHTESLLGGHDNNWFVKVQPRSYTLYDRTHLKVYHAELLDFIYFRKRHVTSPAMIMGLVVLFIINTIDTLLWKETHSDLDGWFKLV